MQFRGHGIKEPVGMPLSPIGSQLCGAPSDIAVADSGGSLGLPRETSATRVGKSYRQCMAQASWSHCLWDLTGT